MFGFLGIVFCATASYPLCIHRLSTILCYNGRDVRAVHTKPSTFVVKPEALRGICVWKKGGNAFGPYRISRVLGKLLLGFLTALLIMPVFFFMRPQKAEALVSLAQCFAAKGTASATAGSSAAAAAVASVPTSDVTNTVTTAQGTAGTDWSACFMKGLTKVIAKTLLHTFTQSIVNWINTGFEGSPSFITNPEGFLNDIADQTIGRVIEDISPLLCSPFRLDIKFALGLNMSLNTREEIHCRLTDVIANVRGAYDGFVAGTVGSGNLSNWIHIAGTPQNNPYGAYIATTNKLSASITSATGQQIKLLDWGKGFKSWRSCKKWGPDIKEGNPPRVVRKGACIEEGPIKTPGSIIQDQATGALGTTLRELEVADEIDEVVGALINQLLVKVMSAGGGLLGASSGGGSSGGSATGSLATNPNFVLANADAKTPEGINCRLRYYPATVEDPEGSGVYVPDNSAASALNNSNQVWTDNLGVGKTVGVTGNDTRPLVPAKYIKQGVAEPVSVEKDPGQTWEVYFAKIRAGCENEWNTLIDNASTVGLGKYTGGSVTTSDKPTTPQTQTVEGNMAQGKRVTQSSSCVGFPLFLPEPYAYVAVDGNRSPGNAYIATIACTQREANPWWEVDLETNDRSNKKETETKEITSIRIYGAGSWNNGTDLGNNALFSPGVIVSVLDSNRMTVYTVAGLLRIDSQRPFVEASIPKIRGRYVRIEAKMEPGKAPRPLLIAEVEVFGTQIRLDASGNTTAPIVPFGFSSIKPQNLPRPEPGVTFGWSNITFVPNQSQSKAEEGIRLRARFYECKNEQNCTGKDDEFQQNPSPFTNWFTQLELTYSVQNVRSNKFAIMPSSGGYIYNTDPDTGVLVEPPPNCDEECVHGIVFAKNLSVENYSINVSMTGTLNTGTKAKKPLRLVVEVLDRTGIPIGSAIANFVTQ